MALIDIIFLIFIGLFALVGLWKGLVDSVVSLFSSLFSVALAIFLGTYVADFVRKLVDIDGYLDSLLTDVFKITQENIEFLGMTVARVKIANYLATILIIVLTYIVLMFAISIIKKILGSLTESSSLLKSLNRLLGMVFGALKGLFIVCCLFAVLTMVSFVEPLRVKFEPTIQESKYVSVIYEKTNQFIEDKLRDKLTNSITES